VDGLTDTPRPNVHRKLGDEKVELVIRTTLENLPKGCTHWSTRKMADCVGVSQSSVARIWRAFELKPHRRKKFSLSTDDLFTEKVRDIVGLYMNPPDNAVVLCVDEKTQVQALSPLQPVLPMGMGYHEGVTSSYTRHGTTNLLAALDVATGKVIGECYPRKRAIEFRQFLNLINRNVPQELEVELVVDNQSVHGAPEIQRWLKKHPRFHMHFVPTYSSWLNLVERWFGKLTDDALRRGHHNSVQGLTDAIMAYIEATNDDPKPFVWTKTADEILASIARHCHRILGA
jgi:transposase